MIGIRIDREHWLQLYADIQLDIVRTSPVFSEDKVFEENSVYNFVVPNTSHNSAILGHPQRVMALLPPTGKKMIEIFYNNNLVAIGSVYVTKSSNQTIELVAGLDESSFASVYGSKKISSFEYGGMMTYRDGYDTEPTSILQVCNGYFPEYPFAFFPIKNTSLFDGSQWETGWRTDPLSRPYQNDYKAMMYDPINDIYEYKTNHISVSPFPYVGFVIENIFKECGYTIEYNIFRNDDNLKRLCIYNPNIIFGVGSNRDYYYININEHLPAITVSEFLKAIKKPFGLNVSINELTKTVSIRSFNQINDLRKKFVALSEDISYETAKKVRFKVHVDGNDSYAKERQQPDEVEKSRYRGIVYTLADLNTIQYPREGDVALVLISQYNDFYQYRSSQSGSFSWERLCYNVQHIKKGEENTDESDFDLDFSVLFSEFDQCYQPILSTNDSWTVPVVEIIGNKRNKPMEPQLSYNDFELKLMMYWGMTGETTSELAYPQGSSTIYEGGLMLPGGRNLSLIPNHPNNFIEKYLSRYYISLTNRRVKVLHIVMTIPDLNDINWMKTIIHDGRLWLTTKINYKLSNSGISIVEMELTEVN